MALKFFTTYSSTNYAHVLEVFNESNPESYTWSNMSNSNGMASINIVIPSTGYYFIRVRAYRQGIMGSVDLNINGQTYLASAPVGGMGFRCENDNEEIFNYFTANSTRDPRIWIESSDGFPGKIIGHNDDYNGLGDFDWIYEFIIKKSFSSNVGAALISENSSYSASVLDALPEMRTIESLSVYPIPCSEVLHICLPSDSDGARLEVFDLSGRKRISMLATSSGMFSMPVSSLSSGSYLLKVIQQRNVYQSYFVVW